MVEAYFWNEKAVGARGKIGIEVIQEWRSSSIDNFSRVTVNLYIGLNSGGPSSDMTNNCKRSITGTNSMGPETSNFSGITAAMGWVHIWSGWWNVGHNINGTKTVTYTMNWGPTITQNFGSGGSVTAGGNLWPISRAPAAPTAPVLTYTAPTTIKAQGTAPAANGGTIDLYHFQFDTNNPPQDGTPNFRSVSGGSSPVVTVNDLAINKTWYVSYAAHNEHGWGNRSPVSSYTIGNVPGAPILNTLTSSIPNKVALGFTPPTPGGSTINKYRVDYRIAGVGAWTVGTEYNGNNTTSAINTTLTPGYLYDVKVLARNNQGWGPASNTMQVRVMAGPRIRINGVWRDCESYVRTGGVWKLAEPGMKKDGTWYYLS